MVRVVTHIANFPLAATFALCEHFAMAEGSLNSKLVALGVSKSYASEIVSGDRSPGMTLAIRIYRAIGKKFGPLIGLSEKEIRALEKATNRSAPQQPLAAE